MKKSVLLSSIALALASTAYAQTEVSAEVVEVYESVNQNALVDSWVADCSQGRLINKNKDNWFITLQGGANMLFGHDDVHAAIKNRIDGNGALYVGKWVTPTFGFRFGANYVMTKGVTSEDGMFRKWNTSHPVVKGDVVQEGYYEQKWMGLGPEFDVMINLTNWWCGYRPGRVYNAVLHGGAGAYWRWAYNQKGAPAIGSYNTLYFPDSKWHAAHNTILFADLGLQNNFRLSKHVDFFIDLQYTLLDEHSGRGDVEQMAEVYLGFTFNLGKTDWNCPVVPVCADITPLQEQIAMLENLVRDLEAKNRQLQAELDACLSRKPEQVVKGDCSQLVTVYYPINQYDLSNRERKILSSVADVMLAHPDQKYQVIGWADNYTGSDSYNETLRWNRVNGVKNYLVKCGVPESQLVVNINNSNLMASPEYNEFNAGVVEVKSAPLDRAVTIRLAD